MNKKARLFGFILTFIICLSASCSSVKPSAALNPIKVEWTLWQGDYTILIANEMGFFKNHGIAVEPIQYNSSSQAIADLAGAKADGGILTMMDTYLAANIADINAVMVSENNDQYAIIAANNIQSISDLRGKRIGLNLHTPSEMYVYYMLLSQHMSPNDVTYVEMSPDQVAKSIPDQIDAGLVWEPYINRALHEGKRILYESDYYSTLMPRLIVFRKALIEQRPNDVRSFLEAWDEAVKYRITHTQESLALISKLTGLSVPELALTSNRTLYSIDGNEKIFSDNPGTDPNSIYFIAQFNLNFFTNTGYITIPPDINTLLDPSLMK